MNSKGNVIAYTPEVVDEQGCAELCRKNTLRYRILDMICNGTK